MKIKGFKITIFIMLLASLCAICFMPKTKTSVYAANDKDNYSLIKVDGSIYNSNKAVGKSSENNRYILGEEDVNPVTAEANTNFQLKGWLVTYEDQSNKTAYFAAPVADKVNTTKEIKVDLKNASNATISQPILTFNDTNLDGYYESGKFQPDVVFENIVVSPVYDHIYYSVNVNSLANISKLPTTNKTLKDGTLYYNLSTDTTYPKTETVTVEGKTITTVTYLYEDAVLEEGTEFYYIGNVYYDEVAIVEGGVTTNETLHYTLHSSLEETPVQEKITLTKNAFRVEDNVNISMDIDIENNKNVDVIGFNINSAENSLTKFDGDITNNYYKTNIDTLKRTTDYEVKFDVINDNNFNNQVNIEYHNLYKVTFQIKVDDVLVTDADVLKEIIGNLIENLNHTERGNVLSANYYSVIDSTNYLEFYAKTSADIYPNCFNVTVAKEISKVLGGISYTYYVFDGFNSGNGSISANETINLENISSDFILEIKYKTKEYDIEFRFAEYITKSATLVNIQPTVNVLHTYYVKRGEGDIFTTNADDSKLVYNEEEKATITRVGYTFKGFSQQFGADIELTNIKENITIDIDSAKPTKQIVYICYEKTEYTIKVVNHSQIKLLNGKYPLQSLTFATDNLVRSSHQFNETELQSLDIPANNLLSVNYKIRIGEKTTISYETNLGFKILGFSFISNANETAEEDYLTENMFELNEALILEKATADNEIIIYVFEDYLNYKVTYVIKEAEDKILTKNVIMANIDVAVESIVADGYTVIKYNKNDNIITADGKVLDASGEEITDATAEEKIVVKIEVDNLKYSDKVNMLSTPNNVPANGDIPAYSYAYNFFTEDYKFKLSEEVTKDAGNFVTSAKHIETVSKNNTVEVVYSMSNTRVVISVNTEFALSENFKYNLVVYQDGAEVNPLNEDGEPTDPSEDVFGGTYVVDPGKVELIIENLAFGYKLLGYKKDGVDVYPEDFEPDADGTYILEINAASGASDIILLFESVEYKFKFNQNGAGLTKSPVKFNTSAGEVDYAVLTIDNRSVEFEKPEGYFVATVHFGNIESLSTSLSETNADRNNLNKITYKNFVLSVENFIKLVTNTLEETTCVNGVVDVNITYVQYTYTITVNRILNNAKDEITYPSIELLFNGASKANSVEDEEVVCFIDVPYGANASLFTTSDPQAGLKFIGWLGDFDALTNVTTDMDFEYHLAYCVYEVQLIYESATQGDPVVRVNYRVGTSVTLYDNIEIIPNSLRDNGYVFNTFVYTKSRYIPYDYNEDSWQTDKENLYVLKDGNYTKTTDEEYNFNIKYYIAQFEDIETDIFYETFNVEDFKIVSENGVNYIQVNIEYELLQMSIENNSKEYASDYKISEKGQDYESKFGALKIDINDFASYVVTIKDETGKVVKKDKVNYFDSIEIDITINDKALNRTDENKEYDLTKGLVLKSIYINSSQVYFDTLVSGASYKLIFAVKDHMPDVGEIINIVYDYQVTEKRLVVTTVVDASERNFYKNIELYIAAHNYGFYNSLTGNVGGKAFGDIPLQFLAKTDVYAKLSSDYKKYFEVSGLTIKIGGREILPSDYAEYGIEDPTEDYRVSMRMLYNVEVIYKIQPIITYNFNEESKFSSSYKFTVKEDGTIESVSQKLTHGDVLTNNITYASMLKDYVVVNYKLVNDEDAYLVDEVSDAGIYHIIISFKEKDGYKWLKDIVVAENVVFEVYKKDIYIDYDKNIIKQDSKPYDGTSSYNVNKLQNSLIITDKNGFSMAYNSSPFQLSNKDAYISYNGKAVTSANELLHYDLYVYNLYLFNNATTQNFNLKNNELLIENYIQIKKVKLGLSIEGAVAYSKVYDGTTSAEINPSAKFTLENVIEADKDFILFDVNKLKAQFQDAEVGINKTIVLDLSEAILNKTDLDYVSNYYFEDATSSGITIYPYSLTVNIKDVGDVTVINKRGLTDKTMVNLLPVNSYLKVEAIYADSSEYAALYRVIGNRIKRNNTFAIGYKVSMVADGVEQNLNKNLYISLPNVKNLTGAYGIISNETIGLKYTIEGNNIVIDLNSTEGNFNQLFFTQKRILLKAWQIVLIVLLGVLIVAGVVITVIIVRKRKIERYSVNEKI